MTVLRQSAGHQQSAGHHRPERGEGVRAVDRWVGEDLARRHGAAFTDALPPGWLSLIAAAERLADAGPSEPYEKC